MNCEGVERQCWYLNAARGHRSRFFFYRWHVNQPNSSQFVLINIFQIGSQSNLHNDWKHNTSFIRIKPKCRWHRTTTDSVWQVFGGNYSERNHYVVKVFPQRKKWFLVHFKGDKIFCINLKFQLSPQTFHRPEDRRLWGRCMIPHSGSSSLAGPLFS